MESIRKITDWFIQRPWLRWIIFLPVAIVSSVIGNFIGSIISRATMGNALNVDSFLFEVCDALILGIITGFIFVYVGVNIAPRRKKTVSILLLIVAILVSIKLIHSEFFFKPEVDYWVLIFSIFIIVGSTVSYGSLKNKGLYK